MEFISKVNLISLYKFNFPLYLCKTLLGAMLCHESATIQPNFVPPSIQTISGVIDDRGKFIYISTEELKAVAEFVEQRGRVSITELAQASNSLINLKPEPTLTLSGSS